MAEYDSTGTLLARYTQGTGIDEPLALQRGGTTAYYHADGLGSITSLTSSDGLKLNTYSYDSFGSTTANEAISNSFRYTGREWDQETGLYYYRARYYDPNIGRFISEDPIGFVGGINVYEYVGNEPQNLSDPSGLSPDGWDTAVQFWKEHLGLSKHNCHAKCDADGYRDASPQEGQAILAFAKKYEGTPHSELDCIHLVAASIHGTVDSSFPSPKLRYSSGSFEENHRISFRQVTQSNAQTGDVMQWSNHVGFYDPANGTKDLYPATNHGVMYQDPKYWTTKFKGYWRVRVPCTN